MPRFFLVASKTTSNESFALPDTRILVVDDEVFNLETLKRTFRQHYTIFTATSGAEGLEILAREQIHVVISDQRMPAMAGTEFLKKVVELYPATIRLILTAYTDVGDLIEAINSGLVYKYVTKPWQPQDLKMTIQRAADHYWADESRRMLTGELRKKNRLLVNQNKELKRVDELKTRFMSVASHELRTPLAIISGSIELLSMMMENLNEKQTHLVKNAMEGTTRLNDIISSVFDLVKIDSDKMMLTFQAFDLQKLIENVLKNYSDVLSERELKLTTSLHPVNVEIDPASIFTVFDKVISNAIKFTPNNGAIDISLQEMENHVVCRVKDTGIGIPADELEHIFDKFYQLGIVDQHSTSKTQYKGGGTGLGLSICQGIVRLHKGNIRAKSAGENQGTTIIIEIPYLHPQPVSPLAEKIQQKP
jgi:two-component system sensor histidine kinase/response regulator